MKTIKSIILSLAALATLTSCEDIFELERLEASPYLSVSDLATTVAAPYSAIFATSGWSTLGSLQCMWSLILI